MRPTILTLALVSTIACLALVPGAAAAQEEAPAAESESPLAIEEVEVVAAGDDPGRPIAVDTLCKLTVTIRNDGEEIASQLAFRVEVNGHELPVYRNQLFMERLDPGESREVRLYNFWTTETGRPAPDDGTLRVEVSLTEAKWYEITVEEDGTEVWTPGEEISGLPVSASASLPMGG